MAAQALRAGLTVQDIHDASKIDPWFIRELARIVDAEQGLALAGLELVGVYDELGFGEPKEDSVRVFYVARRG